MAFTQDDLTAIERAIASGELSARSPTGRKARSVTYRSFAELRAQRDLVMRSLAAASSGTPPAYPRYQQADFSDD